MRNAAILALWCSTAFAAAQPTGEVSGSIADQAGTPLSDVRITIRGVVERAAPAGATGDFVFSALPKGTTRSPQK